MGIEELRIEDLQEEAEQGIALSQFLLGLKYMTEIGDISKGIPWIKKAAENGVALAQNALGNCYFEGFSEEEGFYLEKDMEKAMFWWNKAAEQGNEAAEKSLRENGYKKPASDSPQPRTNSTATGSTSESLIKRGYLFLEDSDWGKAHDYFDKALDIDPEYAPAYVGKLCAQLRVKRESELVNQQESLSDYSNFKKAVRFADENYRTRLEKIAETIINNIAEKKRREQEQLAENERRKQEKVSYLSSIRERIAPYQACISLAFYAVGLKADGTVVVANCHNKKINRNISDWRNIIAVAAGGSHTVGLRADGTVVAVGDNWQYISEKEKKVYDDRCETSGWRNIVAVAAGEKHTVGLRSNGTVVAVGANECGQCNTSNWRDIVAIAAGDYQTVGLKADGTVVAASNNTNGQCNTSNWRDIVAVSTDSSHTVGLKADGTVVAVGYNKNGQCNTSDWRDIVAVSVGNFSNTVGLKADGAVVAAGDNEHGECKISDWRWSNIVAIFAEYHKTIGLKADGSIVIAGDFNCDNPNFRGIAPISKEKQLEMKQRINEEKQWESQGLCRYCGGTLGGLLRRKCKSCGKEN